MTPGWLWVFWGPRVPSAGGGEFRKLKKKDPAALATPDRPTPDAAPLPAASARPVRSRQPPVHHADFVSVAKGRLPVQEQEEPPRLRLAGPAIGAPSSRPPGPPITAAAAASLDRRRASVAQTALFSVRRNRATAAAAAAGDADAVLLEQVEPYRPEQLRGYTRSVNQAVAMLHVNRYRGYNLADINGQRLAEAAAHAAVSPPASPPASSSGADSDPGSDHDSQHSLDDRAPRVSRTRDFDAIVAATKADVPA